MPTATRSVVGSTIARRIRISRFDDENGPCSGFEARSAAKFSSVHAEVHNHFNQEHHLVTRPGLQTTASRLRWPSGAPSRPNGRLGLGVLRHPHTT